MADSYITPNSILCSINGCGKKILAKGYCPKHYKKQWQHGNALYDRKDTYQRFYEKFVVNTSTGCWDWAAFIHPSGYGTFNIEGASKAAHRASYILHKGEIPTGFVVCHKCDNRRCVNPEHLFLGTHADNSLDMVRKGRQSRGERHGTAKLTTNSVITIRRLKTMGLSERRIASKIGVSATTVRDVLHRRTWSHVV